jgi:hypothetical protein
MIDAIIETIITILVIGAGLYKTYKDNMTAHKTTQGKIDAAIRTSKQHEDEISALVKELEDLKSEIKKI